MTAPVTTSVADQMLKTKHRTMWGLGDYPSIARDLIPQLGTKLVAALNIGPGQCVLDVAAGSGNAAIPAALRGADVTASDLTPALLESGAATAPQTPGTLTWQQADAEALPFEDGQFDTTMSCVGVMFAPHHQTAASELIRVTKSGGTIGLLNWTPSGFIGQLFATMKQYVAPPPPGASPPPLWGDPAYVTGLFGDNAEVSSSIGNLRVEMFERPADFRDYFKHRYGPTMAAYAGLGDDQERIAALDGDLDALAERFAIGTGSLVMDWEYVIVVASRR